MMSKSNHSNRTYLVHVKVFHDRIEAGVEIVQQIDDLHRGALRRYRGEADNIAKINSYLIIRFRYHRFAHDQLCRYGSVCKTKTNNVKLNCNRLQLHVTCRHHQHLLGQQLVQQFLAFALLLEVVLRSLVHQGLQIVRILLHALQ